MHRQRAREISEHDTEATLLDAVAPGARPRGAGSDRKLIGVLEGEGIGPEVIGATLHVLAALESVSSVRFELPRGGAIGFESEVRAGKTLSEEVVGFCNDIFSRGGAILSGPGGGRFVYELRQRFDFFCKLSPLKPCPELFRAGHFQPEHLHGVDIMIVRDNIAGVYQGESREKKSPAHGRVAEHTFSYNEKQVRRILEAAARVAQRRRGQLTVVIKEGGVPAASALWRGLAEEIAPRHGVACACINVDHAAYRLVQHPREFDVMVTPNLFGDILADLGGVLMASRGVTFSGNYTPSGDGVYQTNHGSALDLAGTNRANPAGQIGSLAMLLRESFGMKNEAALLEKAVAEVWRQGWRTDDLAERNCKLAGTREMAEHIAQAVVALSSTEAIR